MQRGKQISGGESPVAGMPPAVVQDKRIRSIRGSEHWVLVGAGGEGCIGPGHGPVLAAAAVAGHNAKVVGAEWRQTGDRR